MKEKKGQTQHRFPVVLVLVVLLLMATALTITACKQTENTDVDASAKPNENATIEPTGVITEVPVTEEPTPEITPLPKDVTIIRWAATPIWDESSSMQDNLSVEEHLYYYLTYSEFLDSISNENVLFEVAFECGGYIKEDEINIGDLNDYLQNEANWLFENGYNVKWVVHRNDNYLFYYLYGYFTLEQLLNFPESDEHGYKAHMLTPFADVYAISDDELELWNDAEVLYLEPTRQDNPKAWHENAINQFKEGVPQVNPWLLGHPRTIVH